MRCRFMDDVLDLPWRAKLILPTIATFPLLCSYTGSTAILIPKPLVGLIYSNGNLTPLGQVRLARLLVTHTYNTQYAKYCVHASHTLLYRHTRPWLTVCRRCRSWTAV